MSASARTIDDHNESSLAVTGSGASAAVSLPAHPPALTPGLTRAILRLLRNAEPQSPATDGAADGERHPSALAS